MTWNRANIALRIMIPDVRNLSSSSSSSIFQIDQDHRPSWNYLTKDQVWDRKQMASTSKMIIYQIFWPSSRARINAERRCNQYMTTLKPTTSTETSESASSVRIFKLKRMISRKNRSTYQEHHKCDQQSVLEHHHLIFSLSVTPSYWSLK